MFKIVTIPFNRESRQFDEDILNTAVLNKQITHSKAKFFKDGAESYWTVFIEYDPVLKKTAE